MKQKLSGRKPKPKHALYAITHFVQRNGKRWHVQKNVTGSLDVSKMNGEKRRKLDLQELVMAVRENTNAVKQNMAETKLLNELLRPSLKETEAVKFQELKNKVLLDDCLRTIKGEK